MKLTTDQVLKEIEIWKQVYTVSMYTSDLYDCVTVHKNDVELFSASDPSISKSYRMALDYIEKINPNHELNRHNRVASTDNG